MPRTIPVSLLLPALLSGFVSAEDRGGRDVFVVRLPKKAEAPFLFHLKTPPPSELRVPGYADPFLIVAHEGGYTLGRNGAATKEVEPGKIFSIPSPKGYGEPVEHFVIRRGETGAGEPPWLYERKSVLAGSLSGTSVIFVDHDGDGTFFTPYADYFATLPDGDVHPVAAKLVIGEAAYDAVYDEPGRAVTLSLDKTFPSHFPQWKECRKGLFRANEIRREMKLLPFGLDLQASDDALKHAVYCAANGVLEHEETPGRPYYSPEGSRAGISSIGSRTGSVAAGVDDFLNTLLHRMPLIDPRICTIGIGFHQSYLWIHYMTEPRRAWAGQGPVVFPWPGGHWGFGAFATEMPDPRPHGVHGVGLPITCAFYGGEEVTQSASRLLEGKKEIPCYRHDAEKKELRNMMDPELVATLLPRSNLPYREMKGVLTWRERNADCRFEWTFNIGRR